MMLLNINKLLAPLASIVILTFGQGAYTTWTTMQLVELQAPQWALGFVSSAFFFGLLVGSYFVQHFIMRVHHIRAFAAFAAMIAIVILLQGLAYSIWLWIILRFITGYCLAGIFVVTESWLLNYSTNTTRGRILAIYMGSYYFAQATGQLIVGVPYESSVIPFAIIALCAMLSIIPIAISRFDPPKLEQFVLTSMKQVLKCAPLGVLGKFCSGLILSVVYTLLPFFYETLHKTDAEISYLMMTIILGGMLLQYPLGKLSDHTDKRRVLMGLCISIMVVSFITIFSTPSLWILLTLGFLLGGAIFTLYMISISYAMDFFEQSAIISVSSVLLLAYGIGLTLGPLLVSPLVYVIGQAGYFVYFILIMIIFLLACLYVGRQPGHGIKIHEPYVAVSSIDFEDRF